MPSSITEAVSMTQYRAGSNAPSSALHRVRGEEDKPVFTAVAPSSAVAWSDNDAGGTFEVSGSNNSIAVYTPANRSQTVQIAATDSGGTATRALTVWGTMPVLPQVEMKRAFDVETKEKKARGDGTRYAREEEPVQITYTLAWENRDDSSDSEMLQFWLHHRKVIQFYIVDREGALINKVWFNSAFEDIFHGAQRWGMAAQFKGAFENVPYVAPGMDITAPSVPLSITAVAAGTSGVNLSWTGATDDIAVTGYTVQRATDSSFTTGVTEIPLGNVLAHSDTGLSASTQYWYRVKARDAAGNFSAYSTADDATTDAPASYVLDVITPQPWNAVSVIKLKASDTSPFRVRRASDDAEMDAGFSGNVVDWAAIDAWRAASQVTVKYFYDWSGGFRHWHNLTTGEQPNINDASALVFDGVNDCLVPVSTFPDITAASTWFLLVKPQGVGMPIVGDNFYLWRRATDWEIYIGGSYTNFNYDEAMAEWLLIRYRSDGSNYTLHMNGTQVKTGTVNAGTNLKRFAQSLGGAYSANMLMKAFIHYDSALSGSDITALEFAIHSAHGV